MTHAEIIAALGGVERVAGFLGRNRNTVLYWTRHRYRIPHSEWFRIAEMPEAVAIGLTPKSIADADPNP